MSYSSQAPSSEILHAFCINEIPSILPGGQGSSYRAGNFILKMADDIKEAEYTAKIWNQIKESGFRVARPRKTNTGGWIHKGWMAYSFVEGRETKSRWSEKIKISRKFHQVISAVHKPPDFLDKRTHPWSIADQMVWDKIPLDYGDKLAPIMNRLRKIRTQIKTHDQLIHGDINGNILFHETLPPAIIDFSPYWHPAEYANAIIVVDAIVWEGAKDSLLGELEESNFINQLLIRAAMWRIKTTEEFIKQYGNGSLQEIDSYNHIVELLESRAKAQKFRVPSP